MRVTFVLIMLTLLMAACGGHRQESSTAEFDNVVYRPTEAANFEILGTDGSRDLLIQPLSQRSFARPLMIVRDSAATGVKSENFSVVYDQAKRVVCMSSTYVAMLDALGAIDRVVGVSGQDYINNPAVHNGKIADVGPAEAVDMERLLSLEPDLVLLYGIEGASPMQAKLDELQIPYFYINEFGEQSPLGKAEWLVAIGEMVGRGDLARQLYSEVESRYHSLANHIDYAFADSLSQRRRPEVMLNLPYNGVWYMPPQSSYMVRLIRDAGGQYSFDNQTDQSRPIDLEQAYKIASEADVWLNTDAAADLRQLKVLAPKFGNVKAVTNGQVWASNKRATPAGGNDFYESAVVRPDRVLSDLIIILQPDLAIDSETFYYRQLK